MAPQAAVWCPAVTVPPRVPLSGSLPRGQRRELLWTIGRGAPCFEARVEVSLTVHIFHTAAYFSHEAVAQYLVVVLAHIAHGEILSPVIFLGFSIRASPAAAIL